MTGRPSSRAAVVEVAGRDRLADRRAADLPAIEVERRDDDDIEAVALPELGQRGRRPAALEPERRVGRHQEAGQRDPRPDPLDERVVRASARSASSKCWTTVTATPAASSRSSRSPGSSRSGGALPIRTSSGWWSKVMTVGRASARRGLRDEVLEQVGVAEVQAVEDADDDEDRAERRRERIDPLDDVHAASGDGSGGRRGATKTLSGASRPPRAEAIATSVPSGPTQPVVVGRAGQPARGRTNWPLATAASSSGGQRDDREGVEAGVDRAAGAAAGRPGSPRRPPGSRRAAIAPSSVNGPDAVRASAPR